MVKREKTSEPAGSANCNEISECGGHSEICTVGAVASPRMRALADPSSMLPGYCLEARGSPRRAYNSPRLLRRAFLLVLLISRTASIEAKKDFPAAKQAVENGMVVIDFARRLDVATAGMVVGAVCSAVNPCWPALGKNVIAVTDGTVALTSLESIKLIGLYSGPGSVVDDKRGLGGSKGQMLRPELLRVLDVVSPGSYFLAYAYEGKLYALPPSDACSSMSAAGSPPDFAHRPDYDDFPSLDWMPDMEWWKSLVVVLRRPGMRLLGLTAEGSAAQLLRDEAFEDGEPLHPPFRRGFCAWSGIDPENRRKAREAVEATGDAQLLVDFDTHLPVQNPVVGPPEVPLSDVFIYMQIDSDGRHRLYAAPSLSCALVGWGGWA